MQNIRSALQYMGRRGGGEEGRRGGGEEGGRGGM